MSKAKALISDEEDKLAVPFDEMVPETLWIEHFTKAWRDWKPSKLKGIDSFGRVVHSPPYEINRLLNEALDQNNADKVLAFFYADFDGEDNIYQMMGYEEADKLRNWIIKWAERGDGYWNELLDRSANTVGLQEFIPKPVAKRWSAWAQSLPEGAAGEGIVKPIFKYQGKVPLSIVATHIKQPSAKFLKRSLKYLHDARRGLVEGLLGRTDVDQAACFEVVRELMTDKSKRGTAMIGRLEVARPDLLYQIAAFKHWCPPEMGAHLLAQAKQGPEIPNRIARGGYLARRTMARYANGDFNFWHEAVTILSGHPGVEDQRVLTQAFANPGFPAKLAKSLIEKGLDGQHRKAIATNMSLVKDPEVRQALEKSGQVADVWMALLKTSMDPVEASRLISYLAQSNINQAVKALTKVKLPEGTTLPVAVLTRIIGEPKDKEQRVAVIKSLPKVKPVNSLPPESPKRAKKRQR